MHYLRHIIILYFSLLLCTNINAQKTLSLDSCRILALENNKELKISNKEIQVAKWQRKAALTNYFPKITALGTYLRNEKEISLLSDESKENLKHIGTHLGEKFQPMGVLFAKKHPHLLPVLQEVKGIMGNVLIPSLDQMGNNLVEKFRTDTRNLYVGNINLTQPIYVGGKIRAYDHITNYAKEISSNKNKLTQQEILAKTDQTYWLVVSLSNKKKLADSYVSLLKKIHSDVEKMIQQGVATKVDGLSVRVKVNEAEILQTKVENGLTLAKMSLAQICGLELDSAISLEDEEKNELSTPSLNIASNTEDIAMQNRPEIKSLELATLVQKEKIKVERAEFLPHIALSGNYIVTNPSSINGFENKFKGMWSVGVQVKIPISHWGEGWAKVNKAKAEADIMQYKLEEVKEKITLQVNQAIFKVKEANKHLQISEKNIEKAEENLRYAQLGFQEGVIPPSRVLEAQTAWYDAQSEKIDAQIEMKMSQISLEKALGTLATEK